MGYGNLTEAYMALKQAARYQGPILPGGLLNFGVWGEIIGAGDDPAVRSQVVHPGEAVAAAALCDKAQQVLMPIVDGPGIDISAAVHTTLRWFQYSSPSVQGMQNGTVLLPNTQVDGLVTPSCLIYRPQLIRQERGLPFAPQYWMKLASCDEVVSVASGRTSCPAANFSAVDFNREVFETALSLSTPEARKRFQQRGRPIEFMDQLICDGVPCKSLEPMEWASSKYEITFDVYRNNGTTLLVRLVTLVTDEPAVVYFKSLSVARALEYIMIDSLQVPRN